MAPKRFVVAKNIQISEKLSSGKLGTGKLWNMKNERSKKFVNLQHSTTLSSYIWDLKDKNKRYNIKWTAIDRAPRFNPITKKCRLCLKEKYYIIFQPDGAQLNERSELFSTCRHRRKDLLANI